RCLPSADPSSVQRSLHMPLCWLLGGADLERDCRCATGGDADGVFVLAVGDADFGVGAVGVEADVPGDLADRLPDLRVFHGRVRVEVDDRHQDTSTNALISARSTSTWWTSPVRGSTHRLAGPMTSPAVPSTRTI